MSRSCVCGDSTNIGPTTQPGEYNPGLALYEVPLPFFSTLDHAHALLSQSLDLRKGAAPMVISTNIALAAQPGEYSPVLALYKASLPFFPTHRDTHALLSQNLGLRKGATPMVTSTNIGLAAPWDVPIKGPPSYLHGPHPSTPFSAPRTFARRSKI